MLDDEALLLLYKQGSNLLLYKQGSNRNRSISLSDCRKRHHINEPNYTDGLQCRIATLLERYKHSHSLAPPLDSSRVHSGSSLMMC